MIGVWGRLKHAFCHSCLPTSIKNEDMISISLFTHKSLLLKPVELNFRKLTQWCKEQSTLVVYKFSKTEDVKTPWIGKDELHQEVDWFGDALRKIAIDKHQFTGTHGFLVVNFPLKKLFPWLTWRTATPWLKLCKKPRWTMEPPQQKQWLINTTVAGRFVPTQL